MKKKDDFTHLDSDGNVRMVNIVDKGITRRVATASCTISMRPETLQAILDDRIVKGNVFTVAKVAAISAAKRADELIPLCHPLPLSNVDVDLSLHDDPPSVSVRASTTWTGKTGVEVEALTAAAIACLTVYDMCKAVDREMIVEDIKLLEKSGGVSGDFQRADEEKSP